MSKYAYVNESHWLPVIIMILAFGYLDWCMWAGLAKPSLPEFNAVCVPCLFVFIFLLFLLLFNVHDAVKRGERRAQRRAQDEAAENDYTKVGDERLWEGLLDTGKYEGTEFWTIIDKIMMPDGRAAWQWVDERPKVKGRLREYCLDKDIPLCGKCGYPYLGPALDCKCTNWGKPNTTSSTT